jgi:hypothetical protein
MWGRKPPASPRQATRRLHAVLYSGWFKVSDAMRAAIVAEARGSEAPNMVIFICPAVYRTVGRALNQSKCLFRDRGGRGFLGIRIGICARILESPWSWARVGMHIVRERRVFVLQRRFAKISASKIKLENFHHGFEWPILERKNFSQAIVDGMARHLV